MEAKRAVSELFAYSNTHFRDEEAFFARFNLPGMGQHALAHSAFIARASEFEERLSSGTPLKLRSCLVSSSSGSSGTSGVTTASSYASHTAWALETRLDCIEYVGVSS